MMTEPLLLSVIIVSYNTREMTLECLRTLRPQLDGLASEIWVVDNASIDGSAAAIRSEFPEVRLLESDANVGFGAANNQAMRLAAGTFFLLLNSDAFPEPGAIRALLDRAQRLSGVGVVGPRLLNADGSMQLSCFRFPSPMRAWVENLWVSALLPHHPIVGDYRRWPHDEERTVEWVIGACLLVRRDAYRVVGGFDERFFMYSEEADWQRRMTDAGWRIAFTPAARVRHLGGGSGQGEAARINRYFFESLDLYERKHHGLAGLISLRLAMVVGCFLRMLLWTGVMLAMPQRRRLAQSKARLQSWLFVRQATCWRVKHVPEG